MSHLDETFIKEQKAKLLEEKRRIESELKFVEDDQGRPKFPDMGDEEGENAAEVYTYEQNIAIEHDLEVILAKINSALAAIEKGTYGQCEQGDEIERERLKVVPWASTCIKHYK